MKDYRHFPASELKCPCGHCDGGFMNDVFMEKLITLRETCNFPFVIDSAFRCQQHNKDVGGHAHSAHLSGNAVDIHVSGAQAYMLMSFSKQCGMTGLGVKQHGDYKHRFIHIDDMPPGDGRPRPHVWSYP